MTFSSIKKRNEILSSIYESLLNICDTEEESRKQIRYNMEKYPNEPDFKIYSSCLLFINSAKIKDLFKNYASLSKLSEWRLEQIFMKEIGYVCRKCF